MKDLPFLVMLLAICQKSWEPGLGEVILFSFLRIRKFGSSAKLLACLNFIFKPRRFIFLMQAKKLISMSYGSSASSQKSWRWMRLDLIFMIGDIYKNSNLDPLTNFSIRSRSTKLKNILFWNILPISTRIMWKWASSFEFGGKSGNWKQVLKSKESHCRTKTRFQRKK